MAYLDRVRAYCYYFSPSGTRYQLAYDSLERSGEKKAAIHEIPQQDTPEVQDLGNKARHFPLTCYFSGPDYDLAADAFADALSESGFGELQHPRWGDMQALPITWKQGEGFVDGMGRATFEIDFVRVDPTRFPTSAASIEGGLQAQLSDSQAAANATFVSGYGPVNAADLAACKKMATGGATGLLADVKGVISLDEDLSQQMSAAVSSFNSGIDTLAQDPQALADALLNICRLPGTVATSIKRKIDAITTTLIDTVTAIPGSISQSATDVLLLFGLSFGITESAITGTLNDRADAVNSANAVQDALTLVQSGAEGAEGTGYFVPADVLAQVRAMMAAAAALLLEKAFSLRTARSLVLSGDRTPLELINSLKGPFDDAATLEAALDQFITLNKLGGEALLVIPAGTVVSFYG